MSQSIAKDPSFPLKHAQITDLKDTRKMAEAVKTADIVIIRNGETVGYLVNPAHYEALVEAVGQAGAKLTEAFLKNYEQRHGTLERLDAAYEAVKRGEFADDGEVDEVFGKR
jgi:PHD/YefM family antitoxin component YafN of YafNO toxin-antitoxin module